MFRYLGLFAAGAVLALAMSAPASAQSMRYSWSVPGGRADPAVNNYLSARYDRLLQISPRFRRYRMWKECHTITWPGLRQSCLASFDQYEPVLYRR
jgi:hypothetical protein